jgi:hypothetical protein
MDHNVGRTYNPRYSEQARTNCDAQLRSKGEKLLRKWLTGKPAAPSPDPPAQIIPESLMVPLAALHDCDPHWIDSLQMFSCLRDQPLLVTKIPYFKLLESLIQRHQQEFQNWQESSSYRGAFLTMQGEIAAN